MSAAAVILQFIFALLGWIFSIKGLFVILLGVVIFLVLPIIPRITGEFQSFANFHLWLATALLGRAAIVVTEHADLLLKRMEFDDLGVETITFDDDQKEFEDPDSALHHWMGIPFALADEVHGVLFDPRHSALGKRRKDARDRGEYSIPATASEWEQFSVHEWKRAVFEFPRDAYELVDLTGVRRLVDGGERAEYAGRVENIYRISRDPFKSATSATRFVLILVALLGPFAMMWLLASQGGGGGGGGGGSTVGFGSTLLLIPALRRQLVDAYETVRSRVKDGVQYADQQFPVLAARSREYWQTFQERAKPLARAALEAARRAAGSAGDSAGDAMEDADWRHIGTILGVLMPLPIVFLLVFVFVSPITAILAFIVLGIGFWLLPVLAMLLKPSDRLGGGYARLLTKLGFNGYEKPVFEWTPEKYRLREYSDLDETADVTWYGLAGSLVGFTFPPNPESWGAEIEDAGTLRSMREAVTDGGSPSNSNIPHGYTRVPEMTRASAYAGFAPTKLDDDDAYYVNTGIATSRFNDSATGEKSLRRLLWAKEEYGDEEGLSDRAMIYAMVGCGVLSTALGVFVFFL